jgi:hypothetical protein
MPEIIELLTHYFVTLIKLLKPGGVKVVMVESIAMKHQLIVMNRARKRSPAFTANFIRIRLRKSQVEKHETRF